MAGKKRAAPKEAAATKRKKAKPTTRTLASNTEDASQITTPASLPQSAVFATTELVESILIYLPFNELFIIQRVCDKFKDVIAGSPALQERMFLRSCVPRESWLLRSLSANPSLDHNGRIKDFGLEFVTKADNVTNVIKELTSATLCPLGTVKDGDESAAWGLQDLIEECIIDVVHLREHPGSWRNLLLTDPSCYKVKVHGQLWFEESEERFQVPRVFYFDQKVSNNEGIRLGTLMDAMLGSQPQGTAKNKRYKGGWHKNGYAADEGTCLAALKALESYRKGSDLVERSEVRVELRGVAVPTEEEWEEVRSKTISEVAASY